VKYTFEDPEKEDRNIDVPRYVQLKIVKDYLQTTYYWSVGIFCLLIGFLIGVAV
jgi:hypothetical protein